MNNCNITNTVCHQQSSAKEECYYFPDWQDCNTGCGDKGDFEGYSIDDGCVQVCINDQIYIGKSLTPTKNKDHPLDGSMKISPTWVLKSLCAWLAGCKGDKGDKGDQGIQGIQGIKGDTGAKGDKGDAGAAGVKGDQGIQGIQGVQGIQGEKGDKGDKGDPGTSGGSSITNLSQEPNYNNGTIQINSSDGADTVIDICDARHWPSAWARVGTTNNQGANGDKPPNVSLNDGKSHLTGGFTYNGSGHFVVPKNGTYRVMYRPAVIATQQILYPNGNRCLVKLMINGVQFSQLIMQDHTGIHTGEELNDFRDHDIALSAGDTVTINVAEESAGHWLDAYDLKLQFINSSMTGN